MSTGDERATDAVAGGARSKVLTKIAYCDHLDVYVYMDASGEEFLFDTEQLEQSIDSYLKQGDTRRADFMVQLTAMARLIPHRLLWFDDEGKPHDEPLSPKKTAADEVAESAEGSVK